MSFYDCEQCINVVNNKDEIFDGMMCLGVCAKNNQDTCDVTTSLFHVCNQIPFKYAARGMYSTVVFESLYIV